MFLYTEFPESARHIRPIAGNPTVKTIKPKIVSPEASIQRQLESSFFDGNSSSVKTTVDFISERIASNYVKILRKMMIDERNELALHRIFGECATKKCTKKMLRGVNDFVDKKCQISVSILIGESLSDAALKICHGIAVRYATDKIGHWVSTHIKAGE